ncbi:MAG: TlpA disulfide reductase family protein [Actinomycetota bacterium]
METSSQTTIEEPDPAAEPGDGAERNAFSGRSIFLAVSGAVLAIVLLFALLADGESTDSTDPLVANDQFDSLIFLNSDGTEGVLSDYAGEPLVVNFFASWCGPCRAELPEFERVSNANEGSVRFLGISHDLDEVTWRSFVEETSVTYDTVFQPDQELFIALDAKGMPTTAFISPEGEVLQVWTGILSEEKLQELINENLVEA